KRHASITYQNIDADIAACAEDNCLTFELDADLCKHVGKRCFCGPIVRELLRAAFFGLGANVFCRFGSIGFKGVFKNTELALSGDPFAGSFLSWFGFRMRFCERHESSETNQHFPAGHRWNEATNFFPDLVAEMTT